MPLQPLYASTCLYMPLHGAYSAYGSTWVYMSACLCVCVSVCVFINLYILTTGLPRNRRERLSIFSFSTLAERYRFSALWWFFVQNTRERITLWQSTVQYSRCTWFFDVSGKPYWRFPAPHARHRFLAYVGYKARLYSTFFSGSRATKQQMEARWDAQIDYLNHSQKLRVRNS